MSDLQAVAMSINSYINALSGQPGGHIATIISRKAHTRFHLGQTHDILGRLFTKFDHRNGSLR